MTKSETKKSSKDKKIAGSGLRVLEILKELTKEPLSPQELLLGIEEVSDNVYRKEVVMKYINTLKLLGFKLSKINGKYVLERNFEKIDFNKTDLSIIKFIEKYSNNINMQTLKENIFNALSIVEKTFSDETLEIIQNKNLKPYRSRKNAIIKDENVKPFEKYCKDGQKLEIVYSDPSNKSTQKYKVAPLGIKYRNCRAVLVCYDCNAKEYKNFAIEYIIHAEQTPQKNTKDYPSAVTFMLKNRLSRSYVLKDEEKILNEEKDYIIVSNSKEDRDLLVKRLLRYYDQCEILYPKDLRKNMVSLIEDMEKIYE